MPAGGSATAAARPAAASLGSARPPPAPGRLGCAACLLTAAAPASGELDHNDATHTRGQGVAAVRTTTLPHHT